MDIKDLIKVMRARWDNNQTMIDHCTVTEIIHDLEVENNVLDDLLDYYENNFKE